MGREQRETLSVLHFPSVNRRITGTDAWNCERFCTISVLIFLEGQQESGSRENAEENGRSEGENRPQR